MPKSILAVVCFLISISIDANTVISVVQGDQVLLGFNDNYNDPDPKFRIIPGGDSGYGRLVFSYSNNWSRSGINEQGLVFATIPDSANSWKEAFGKENLSGNLCDKILSECKNIAEVLNYYDNYNDPTLEHSYLVFADTSGQTVFISWVDDSMSINICQGVCVGGFVFDKIDKKLNQNGVIESQEDMRDLLDIGHRKELYPTLYSAVYDLHHAMVHLYYYHNYEESHTIDLKTQFDSTKQEVLLASIFSTEIPVEQLEQLKSNHFFDQLKSIPVRGWIIVSVLLTFVVICPILLYMFFKRF